MMEESKDGENRMYRAFNSKQTERDLEYIITEEGINTVASLDSDYCRQYKKSVIDVYEHVGKKTAEENINMIRSMSLSAIRSGEGR